MSRKFIATVLAAALTITTVSANSVSAQNSNDEFGRFVAGAAVLAITGLILNEALSDDGKKSTHKYSHKPKPIYKPKPVYKHKPVYKPKPKLVHRNPVQHSRAIPQTCLRPTTSSLTRYFVPRPCLLEKRPTIARLPDQCLRFHPTHTGKQAGYGLRCLRDKGFYVTSR